MLNTNSSLVAAIREHGRQRFAKAAVRWQCNDYPFAALVSMIDARARVLQLQGVRMGHTLAVEATRGIDAVIDIAALWALGTSVIAFPAGDESLFLHTMITQANVQGIMSPGADVRPTGLNQHPPRTGNLVLVQSEANEWSPAELIRFSACQLTEHSNRAEATFGLSNRTVLGLAPVNTKESLLEIWSVLANGGTVDLLTDFEANDPRLSREHLVESDIDLVQTTPARARTLLAAPQEPAFTLPKVRDVILRGATPDYATLKLISVAFPNARLHEIGFDPFTSGR